MKAISDLFDQELENRLKGAWKKTGGPKAKVKAPAEEPTPEPSQATKNGRTATPLSPLGDGVAEQPTTSGERDDKGRFAKGWKGGPGNPFGRKLAELRTALLSAVTAADMRHIAEGLVRRARTGYLPIVKLLLLYTIGRPAEPVNPDRVDLDEWALLDASPTRVEMWRALIDTVPPELAAEFLKSVMPATMAEAQPTARLSLLEGEKEDILKEREQRRKSKK